MAATLRHLIQGLRSCRRNVWLMDDDIPALGQLRTAYAEMKANWPAIERDSPPGTPVHAQNVKLLANIKQVLRLDDDIEALIRRGGAPSQQHIDDVKRQLLEVSHSLKNVAAFASEHIGDDFIKPERLDELP
jgi:uncharacterized protein (DUF4415 family)